MLAEEALRITSRENKTELYTELSSFSSSFNNKLPSIPTRGSLDSTLSLIEETEHFDKTWDFD